AKLVEDKRFAVAVREPIEIAIVTVVVGTLMGVALAMVGLVLALERQDCWFEIGERTVIDHLATDDDEARAVAVHFNLLAVETALDLEFVESAELGCDPDGMRAFFRRRDLGESLQGLEQL